MLERTAAATTKMRADGLAPFCTAAKQALRTRTPSPAVASRQADEPAFARQGQRHDELADRQAIVVTGDAVALESEPVDGDLDRHGGWIIPAGQGRCA